MRVKRVDAMKIEGHVEFCHSTQLFKLKFFV